MWRSRVSLYSARVFLDRGLLTLSIHHLFFDVISIFRTLCLPFVPDASGHWCLLLWSYHIQCDRHPPGEFIVVAMSQTQGHCSARRPEEDLKDPPTPVRETGDMWSLKDDQFIPKDLERN